MADKRIQDLTPASSVQTSDRFVLEQSGQAKSLTGQILINDLAAYLDGHGGISDISYTAPSSGELDGTLTITLADETEETFTVTNGRGIVSISKTGTEDLVDEYTVEYNDGSESNFYVTNGEKGDTGDNWFVHIKWSETEPDSDSDISDIPSDWIGIYAGLSETAPSHYTDYSWYEYKGEKGDTGTSIVSVTLDSSSALVDTYKVLFSDNTYTTFNVTNGSNIDSITKSSTSGLTDTYTVLLTNGDATSFNVVNAKSIASITAVDVTHVAGHTDVYRINYNDGDSYTFSIYNGTNGSGSVSTVDEIESVNQDVPLLILGSGAPTTSTVGVLKQRYFDQNNSILYICTGVDTSGAETTYTWQGSGTTVDSALSSVSTNPVQNAVLTTLLGTVPLDTTAQTLTGAVNELKSSISGFADNIAEEYDSTATYAVGDYCIYESVLYQCNTAISTPEAWNSLHWTQSVVADGLVEIPDKVSKSGDTMTGDLTISGHSAFVKATNITDGTAPSALTWGQRFGVLDNANNQIAFIHPVFETNGKQGASLRARRKINGEDHDAYLTLSTDASGAGSVSVSSPAAWRSAIGAVNKAGDTMTGSLFLQGSSLHLTIKDPNIDSSVSAPAARSQWSIDFVDKNGKYVSYMQTGFETSGLVSMGIGARRIINGSNVTNGFSLQVDSSGTKIVNVDNAPAWRSALNIGASGAYPITIAQGGSGQTAVSSESTTSNVATAASGYTINTATYKQWGKVGMVYLAVKKTAAASGTDLQCCTIASGKRPAFDCGAHIQTSGDCCYIGSNGVVHVNGSWGANSTKYIMATYIIP